MSEATRRMLASGARLPPLPTIRELIKLYNLRAIKQLSQNFIMDERLTDKIVKSSGRIDPCDTVLEVGPGPGAITRSIIRREPKRLVLVEKDRRFMPTLELLKECVAPFTEIDIFNEDILHFNMEQHLPDKPEPHRLHLIGNLPFAISTRLLINWLHDLSLRRGGFHHIKTCMTLTFQKEVADRICAKLGNKQRCRLSIMSQIWTEPVLKFIIPGRAFVPKPDVDVGVVKLIPYKRPKTELPFELVERVVRHIFNMRQKYCRRGYSMLFPPSQREDATDEMFKRAEVNDKLRPFELSVDECLRLTAVYSDHCKIHQDVAEYDFRGPKQSLLDGLGGRLNWTEDKHAL